MKKDKDKLEINPIAFVSTVSMKQDFLANNQLFIQYFPLFEVE